MSRSMSISTGSFDRSCPAAGAGDLGAGAGLLDLSASTSRTVPGSVCFTVSSSAPHSATWRSGFFLKLGAAAGRGLDLLAGVA